MYFQGWLRKSRISGPGFFFWPFKAPSLGFPIKINFIFFWGKQLHVEYEDTSNTETCSHSSATNHFNLRSGGRGGPLHHGSVNSYLSLSDERMKERKALQENHKVTKHSTEQSQGSGWKSISTESGPNQLKQPAASLIWNIRAASNYWNSPSALAGIIINYWHKPVHSDLHK